MVGSKIIWINGVLLQPSIEEFNHPMPENCAGGTTGVFVNDRELHQKDLDLLASRGLPLDRDRSYIIDISGRVRDDDTGEELDSLGKLAPTVEKVKHGFGMKTPRAASWWKCRSKLFALKRWSMDFVPCLCWFVEKFCIACAWDDSACMGLLLERTCKMCKFIILTLLIREEENLLGSFGVDSIR